MLLAVLGVTCFWVRPALNGRDFVPVEGSRCFGRGGCRDFGACDGVCSLLLIFFRQPI